MAAPGLGGVLVEAYVMRSLHKEKMKKMEREQQLLAANMSHDDDDKVVGEEKFPGGCFFWVSKKTHSAKVASASDYSTDKPV